MVAISSRPNPRLTALRRVAQRLSSRVFPDVAAAARTMLALQAQDFAGACWSLGLRVDGATEATVLDALARREVVRSWPMRGTLHMVAAEDLGWMLSLTTERLIRGAATRRAQLGLDDAQLAHARTLARDALSGGRRLTREALLAVFDQAGLSTASQRGYHILWHLSQTSLLCFGPPEEREQTFVLLDEWVTAPRRLDRDQALGEFARRYFSSHGPATVHDFAWWSSLRMKDVYRAVAVAGDALATIGVDGTSYLLDPALLDAPEPAPDVLTLPGFDEYLLGYQNRSAALPAAFAPRIVPGNNGMFLPTIVVDGQVVGTWKRTKRARHIAVEAQPFTAMTKRARDGFTRAADHYGRFMGAPVEVTFTEVAG